MAKAGKKYLNAVSLVDKAKYYEPLAAIELAKSAAFAKFDESVEVSVKLGVEPEHADQMVRGSVLLPHGTGRVVRVLAFAKGDKAKEALTSGADYVGEEDLIAKVEGGWFEFDSVVATPDMMSKVSKIGKLLGTKGLMPNPKLGTVTNDLAGIIKQLKTGRVEFRTEKKAGNIHAIIGKRSFETAHLLINLKAFIDALIKLKPSASKGVYIRSVSISTTMGPGVKIDTAELLQNLSA
ncbi:MAG: 50S ribosomal protein L1 [Deferribacteraceae bacterium]|jgi:large subunit ribosomal protein L1|nr:50S ribosomal protein L1 [Deferribacteraceae bacterium]